MFENIYSFSIHPRYKHDIGYRLSRSGLAVAYGQQVEFQGPIVQDVTHSTSSHTVNITYAAVSSIDLRTPNGFEVYNSSVSYYLHYFIFRVTDLLPGK